jgi:carbamoyltransferase
MLGAYLGSGPAEGDIDVLLGEPTTARAVEQAHCVISRPEQSELCDQVATAISEGLVIGWFEGRMEWGPRALGHRSILGDPRRADMKDILNLKIKRRESFRPFAPSVLREAVADWFSLDGDVPFMMQVYPIREEKRSLIPAVTHADGTGRLQTVTEADNGRYYHLIRAFQEKTGVPMVLNTSFNENEPIVCTPAQALDCFLRTRMDVLVLGDVLIRRQA